MTAPAAGSTTSLGTVQLPAGAILLGTVTKGGAPAPDSIVQVRVGGTAAANRFVNVQARADGTYTVSLPAGLSIARVCAFDVGTVCPATTATGTTYGFLDGVAMGTVGTSLTVNIAY